MTLDDRELLRRYTLDGSEEAFGELVGRHVGLVFSAALRQTGGDTPLAQDIAQLVFTNLARKAADLLQPTDRVTLAGWLHCDTRLTALEALRKDKRRRIREREAVTMNKIDGCAADGDWGEIRPVLDEMLEKLHRTDRDALLLRFLEQRTLGETGAALGLTEEAARKRVSRALEKLRALMARRGVTITTAAMAVVLTTDAVQAVPAGLAVSLAGASLAVAAAATPASTSTLGLIKLMASTKLKLSLAALALAGIAIPFVLQRQANDQLRADNDNLRRRLAASRPAPPMNRAVISPVPDEPAGLSAEHRELLRLRGVAGSLRRQLAQTNASTFPGNDQTNGLYEFHSVNKWANAGLGTPESAVQTHLWAEAHEDREMFLRSIGAPPGADPRSLDVVAGMPAFKNWTEVADGYRLLAVNTLGDGLVEVQTQTEWKNGKKDVGLQVFKRFGDEWKALVFSFQPDESHSMWAFVHPGQLNANGEFVNGIPPNGAEVSTRNETEFIPDK